MPLPNSTIIGAGSSQETEYSLPGSPELRQIKHALLGNWVDVRPNLRPRYWQVWWEIFLCLLMMISGYITHLFLTARFGNVIGLEIGAVFAAWIGFWLNALLTFGHEAAHYNLSPGHARNDLLADWTIWLFFPQTTKTYRKSHWQHHLHLGDPNDTEISYHNCLSPWFLTKALTGIYLFILVIRYVFGQKRKTARFSPAPQAPLPGLKAAALIAPLRALTTHAIFVVTALHFHCYATAVVWVAGAALIFPFLATVRQILEHRSVEAACATDFRQVSHGPVNRMFGKSVFSRFYGAAGFNRHLLHHWDPTVSYTRFDEMEAFFSGTPLSARLVGARSTYLTSLILLTRKALRDRS
jgi:fatty acid desaturase